MKPFSTVLVTGATGGIGRATALLLARKGLRVFASGRNREALQKIKQEAAEFQLDTLELDVAKLDSIQQALESVRQLTAGRGVEVLVNNAGFGRLAPMELVSEQDLQEQFATNVFGPVRLCREVLADMRRYGRGRIVNISSLVGRLSLPLQGVYCATKHALEAISDALRIEAAACGVRVVLVEPGAINTNFGPTALAHREQYRAAGEHFGPALDRYGQLLGRMYRNAPPPERVARCIYKIISARRPRARYVVPWHNRFMLFAYKLVPTRIVDAAMRRTMRLGHSSPPSA